MPSFQPSGRFAVRAIIPVIGAFRTQNAGNNLRSRLRRTHCNRGCRSVAKEVGLQTVNNQAISSVRSRRFAIESNSQRANYTSNELEQQHHLGVSMQNAFLFSPFLGTAMVALQPRKGRKKKYQASIYSYIRPLSKRMFRSISNRGHRRINHAGGGGGGGWSLGGCVTLALFLQTKRSRCTYRRRWSFARWRRWRGSSSTVVHRTQTRRRSWSSTQTWRRRTWHIRRRRRRREARIPSVAIARVAARRWGRGWRSLLMPGSSSCCPIATSVTVVATTVLSPRRCRLIPGAIVVPRSVPTALLPGSHVRRGRLGSLPRFDVAILVLTARSSFDPTRSFAITGGATRQLLHELLKKRSE